MTLLLSLPMVNGAGNHVAPISAGTTSLLLLNGPLYTSSFAGLMTRNRSFSRSGVRGSGVLACTVATCHSPEKRACTVMACRKVQLGCWRPKKRNLTMNSGNRTSSRPRAASAYTPFTGCCVKSTIVLTALSMNTMRRPWVFSEVDGLYHSGDGFALASKIATIEGR